MAHGDDAALATDTTVNQGQDEMTIAKRSRLSRKPKQAQDNGGPDPFYRPKAIKRDRRTKAAMGGIQAAILDILEADHPQTVRQVFYALTARKLIAKAEAEYHQTVVRLLGKMRHADTIPFEWIADNTRWQRKAFNFRRSRFVSRCHGQILSP